MSITGILSAAAVVGVVGIFVGLFLGVAGIRFHVEKDEKEEAVLAALPGNNCGGCGFPGCSGLAAAIAKGEAPVNACPVGGMMSPGAKAVFTAPAALVTTRVSAPSIRRRRTG